MDDRDRARHDRIGVIVGLTWLNDHVALSEFLLNKKDFFFLDVYYSLKACQWPDEGREEVYFLHGCRQLLIVENLVVLLAVKF